MNWTKLTIRTTSEGAEIVTGVLLEAGVSGALIEDRADALEGPPGRWDILDEEVLGRMDEDVKVTCFLPEDGCAQEGVPAIRAALARVNAMDLGLNLGKLTVELDSVPEEDWAEYWKRDFHPLRVGERFVVKPSWCGYEARPGDRVIEIDPGMAFGSGTHETTALCIELLEAHVRPGDFVVDVGTGTGILAIAASLAGASDVLAIDIDPLSVRVACENVARNGLQDRIRIAQGDLLDALDGQKANVLVANIVADVILFLAAPARARIAPGGAFLCSGISAPRKDEVLSALRAAGYEVLDVREAGEWVAVAARA